MALIGFARVSTQQQDLSEQIQVLKEYGCKKIFQGSIPVKLRKIKHNWMNYWIMSERVMLLQ